ncbi:MAG: EVE domain-containing protein, partial [Candidatus Dadabacteria bacterium]|nr:EVE domain-containing protein [Candidatus Dadabacteria bacterium]NIQ13082.1 EVE domain-containing protein [Candidatus Dadabacteria bacterium]
GIHRNDDGEEVVTFKIVQQFPEVVKLDEISSNSEFKDSNFIKSSQGSLFKLTEKQFNIICD